MICGPHNLRQHVAFLASQEHFSCVRSLTENNWPVALRAAHLGGRICVANSDYNWKPNNFHQPGFIHPRLASSLDLGKNYVSCPTQILAILGWLTLPRWILNWRFPEWGYPSHHPFLEGISICKPTSYWGTPMTMEPPIWNVGTYHRLPRQYSWWIPWLFGRQHGSTTLGNGAVKQSCWFQS